MAGVALSWVGSGVASSGVDSGVGVDAVDAAGSVAGEAVPSEVAAVSPSSLAWMGAATLAGEPALALASTLPGEPASDVTPSAALAAESGADAAGEGSGAGSSGVAGSGAASSGVASSGAASSGAASSAVPGADSVDGVASGSWVVVTTGAGVVSGAVAASGVDATSDGAAGACAGAVAAVGTRIGTNWLPRRSAWVCNWVSCPSSSASFASAALASFRMMRRSARMRCSCFITLPKRIPDAAADNRALARSMKDRTPSIERIRVAIAGGNAGGWGGC